VSASLLSEELEVLKIVTGRLDRAGISYMVTGSIALNYYAVPRMTRDIDLVVEVSPADTERLCALFQDDFYLEPETVRDAVTHAGTFNLIHTRLVVKVDMVVRKSDEYRRTEFSRRRQVSLDDHAFFIVAPEDLVISKLEWARHTRSEVQLGDVRNVLRSVPGLDRSYLECWIGDLGLDALYREATA
jgi:hypothetical protein